MIKFKLEGGSWYGTLPGEKGAAHDEFIVAIYERQGSWFVGAVNQRRFKWLPAAGFRSIADKLDALNA